MAEIEVRIGRDGRIHAETHGLKGTGCLAYIAKLERALDARTVASDYTDEFYEVAGVVPLETQEQRPEEDERLRPT